MVNTFGADVEGGGCELKGHKACEAAGYANMNRMSAAYFHRTASLNCPVTFGRGGSDTSPASFVADLATPLAEQLRQGLMERSCPRLRHCVHRLAYSLAGPSLIQQYESNVAWFM